MTPKLIILSAPSGAGKTTLSLRLLKELQSHLRLSISCTTRAPRGAEKNAVDYFFISHLEFENKIKENQFAEWAKVHDHYYGTSKEFIDDCFKQGVSVLLDIDVQGAESLRKLFGNLAYSIFIAPPSIEVLENRLRGRKTDSEEVIQKRMKNAKKELLEAPKFHTVIINNDIELAFTELKQVVLKIIGAPQTNG